jgi:hypothetical protein
MADHTVQRFEHHQIGPLLDCRWQRSGNIGAELDRRHLGCIQRGNVVRQRGLEPAVADRSGLEIMGEAADLGGGVPQARGQPFGVLLVWRTSGHALAQGLGRESCSGQQRGDSIMQVAP